VLGNHVRQAGAQKGIDSSRLDIRHFERITREQVKEIERVANALVRDDVPVRQEWPDRNEAESEHGFDLYQGGVPPGTNIRLIHVGDEDVQACAGTHVERTGRIGAVKVLKTEPVQDGVERIVFAAGGAAVEATQRTEDALYDAARALDVDPLDVPETAERFFEEWKGRGKEIESLKKRSLRRRVRRRRRRRRGGRDRRRDRGDTAARRRRGRAARDRERSRRRREGGGRRQQGQTAPRASSSVSPMVST